MRRSRAPLVAAILGVVAVTAVVVAIVVSTRSGGDGRGSAAAAADAYAAALAGNDASRAAHLMCDGVDLPSDARGLIGDVKSAGVDATTQHGDSGTATLHITATLTGYLPPSSGSTEPNARKFTTTFGATLALARASGGWCVRDFEARTPTF